MDSLAHTNRPLAGNNRESDPATQRFSPYIESHIDEERGSLLLPDSIHSEGEHGNLDEMQHISRVDEFDERAENGKEDQKLGNFLQL